MASKQLRKFREQTLLFRLRATHLTRPQLRRQLRSLDPKRTGTSKLRKRELQEALAAEGAKQWPSFVMARSRQAGWGWLA